MLKNLPLGEKCTLYASSNSMLPIIKVGDKLTLKRVKIEDVKKLDIVAFFSVEINRIVVHRVTDLKNHKKITTMGDNNPNKDLFLINKVNFLGKLFS